MGTQTMVYVIFGALCAWGLILILQEIHAGIVRAHREDAKDIEDAVDDWCWKEGDGEEWKR